MLLRAALVLVVTLLLAPLASAGGYVFRWVDARGDLHVTDRLADVPEPYHSMYAAQIKRLEQQKGKAKTRTPPRQPSRPQPPTSSAEGRSGPSIVDQEIARQKYWRDLVAHWRKELAAATAGLEAINQELAQARLNPLLRTTPPVKAKIAEIEVRRKEALAKVEAARTMLLKTIPERARKERVPPKWIM